MSCMVYMFQSEGDYVEKNAMKFCLAASLVKGMSSQSQNQRKYEIQYFVLITY